MKLFTDQMALHILELSKFNKAVDKLTTDLDRWLYFLRHGAELDWQAPPEPLNTPEVLWAIGDLFMISQTDPEREIYEARLRARREAASHLRTAREEGREEGRAELLRQLIQPLQRTLGREITPSEELFSLSSEELEKAWTELQANLPQS